jgi:hypothetical protein
MELDQLTIPTSVRDSTNYVMENATAVKINDGALSELVELIRARFKQGFDSVEEGFGSTNDLDKDINLVFFETAANFCFWAQDPKNKWKFEHNEHADGGWYGLRNAFAHALENNIPVYDADFMSTLSLDQAAELFRGQNDIQIPLLEQRVNNIVEAAAFLIREHDGSAKNFLARCNYDAPTIAKQVTQSLSSFRDGAWYKGQWVWILKRAQILPKDLSQLTQKYSEFVIENTNQLTVFADYRLPQILQRYGAIEYSQSLAGRINAKQLLPNSSVEEIEIRAATIVACEKLGKLIPEMTIADIDVSLWLISQDMRDDPTLQPHHLTISSYY